MTKVLLVNREGKVTGTEEKTQAHQGEGKLHRAFSIYIFNGAGDLLIQKRSKLKPLWPLFWANSCCSHPLPGEDLISAGERRLREELGFSCPLRMVDEFQYSAKYKDKGSENELCAVLVGVYNGPPQPDPEEVANWKWVKPDKILRDFNQNPDSYAPWFKIGLKRYLDFKQKKKKHKQQLYSFLEKTSQKVDPIINDLLKTYTKKDFHKLMTHQVKTGGKRLRPALVFLTGKLMGAKEKDLIYTGAGIEILHNTTLVIDDIIDHSSVRRGKPTVWNRFGQSIAECVGLDYSASIYLAANYSNYPRKISEIYSASLKTVIDGELFDILFEQKGRESEPYVVKNRYQKVTLQSYYKMVGKKTAELIKACCEIGSVCGRANLEQTEALKNYGYNLGMAFQIQDDILDIFGEEEEFGKKIGKDIEERKLGNIVIFYALKELSSSKENKILKILKKNTIQDKDIEEAIGLIKETDSYRRSFYLAERFVEQAKQELDKLPQNKWKEYLRILADFTIERKK